MSFQLLIEDLRAAAKSWRGDTASLAGYDLKPADVSPVLYGHVELAAWLTAVTDQCDEAGKDLRSGAVEIAGSLEESADLFQQSDEDAKRRLDGPR